MALIDELTKANIEALKAHDQISRAVLSVVINKYKMEGIELKAKGVDISDKDMIRIISKVLKELEEEEDKAELASLDAGKEDDLPLPPPKEETPYEGDESEDDFDDDEEMTDEEIDEEIDKEFKSVYESEFEEGVDE